MACYRFITHPKTQETLTLGEWAAKLNIKPGTLATRLKKYSDPDKIFQSNSLCDRLITHPETEETLTLTQWAKKLGIHPASLSYRLNSFDIKTALSNDARIGAAKWSGEENEILKEAFFSLNPVREYQRKAKEQGFKLRSKRAIQGRISVFQRQGILPFKKGNLEVAVSNGLVNVTQLSQCLGISTPCIENFFKKGLRYQISQQSKQKIISLHDFAKWVVKPVGASLVSKAIAQDRIAVQWIVEIIGKWLWIN